ncbi:MAG TPA: diguanylate cyclase [Actinomycetota bacterium]|nr:diguanylate cyclase [Actinomycetota bacterium]
MVLPVTAVTAYGWQTVARSTQRQVRSELELARRSAAVAFTARVERAHEAVATLARDPALLQAMSARDATQVRAVLRRQAPTDLLVAVTAPDHRVLGRAGHTNPGFLPGVQRAPLGMVLAPKQRVRSWPMLQRHSADLRARGCRPAGSRRCLLGTVTAGIWIDSQELQRLARGTLDADLTLVIGDTPVASTVGRLTAGDRVPVADGTRRGKLAGRQVVMSTEPLTDKVGEQARLLVSIPATPTTAGIDSRLLAIVLLGLVVVCLVATLLGSVLARLVSRPLGELAAQARAIARGDFASPPTGVRSSGEIGDLDLPPRILRSRGELGELARAFERMRVELGEYLSALRSSRDELARSMNRLGETLSSTHDLPKLLAVVLEAAVQARRAKAGSLLLLTPDRTALVREATHGLTQRDPAERIPVGQGVAGTVASNGRAIVLASPAGNGASGEPAATTQVTVPLLAQGRVLGVLSLYDREDGEPFTLGDAEALTAFAVQAAVAIENVQLHAEAERLSVTDPLTGAWNYRYFERRSEQEIERSRRFGRVLALLMLDIDHFKAVNDRYGHQRGDEVLVEFRGRVTGSVRDIDTFARYGGEEFVLILPETNLEGGLAVAEKLRVATHRTPFCADGIHLTVSIGVACFPEHATAPEELLRAADEALYEAKLQGRDRVVTAGPRLLPLTARPGQVKGRAARVE